MKVITLHTLLCEETEDSTGADTCRLEVSRDGARSAKYRWTLNNGESVPVDKTYHCRDDITVKLWDEDVGGLLNGVDRDDFLGSNSINDATNGREVVEFTGDGAHYRLSYSVYQVADAGAPTPTWVSFREMAKRMDPLYPPRRFRGAPVSAGGNVMNGPVEDGKGLWPMHRLMNADREPSLRELGRRHQDPDTSTSEFLFHNTWLLDLGALEHVPTVDPIPDITARTDEFAREIARHYDIAGLTEVFNARELYRIRNRLPGQFTDATGPGATGEDLYSGGLVTLTKHRIVESRHHKFEEQGAFWSADSSSSKGVLLTVVDVGAGKIDLYTTHLFAGDEDDEDTYPYRFDQLNEVLNFGSPDPSVG